MANDKIVTNCDVVGIHSVGKREPLEKMYGPYKCDECERKFMSYRTLHRVCNCISCSFTYLIHAYEIDFLMKVFKSENNFIIIYNNHFFIILV